VWLGGRGCGVVWAGRKARSLVKETTGGESEDELAANFESIFQIYVYIHIFGFAKTDLKRSRKTITSEYQKF